MKTNFRLVLFLVACSSFTIAGWGKQNELENLFEKGATRERREIVDQSYLEFDFPPDGWRRLSDGTIEGYMIEPKYPSNYDVIDLRALRCVHWKPNVHNVLIGDDDEIVLAVGNSYHRRPGSESNYLVSASPLNYYQTRFPTNERPRSAATKTQKPNLELLASIQHPAVCRLDWSSHWDSGLLPDRHSLYMREKLVVVVEEVTSQPWSERLASIATLQISEQRVIRKGGIYICDGHGIRAVELPKAFRLIDDLESAQSEDLIKLYRHKDRLIAAQHFVRIEPKTRHLVMAEFDFESETFRPSVSIPTDWDEIASSQLRHSLVSMVTPEHAVVRQHYALHRGFDLLHLRSESLATSHVEQEIIGMDELVYDGEHRNGYAFTWMDEKLQLVIYDVEQNAIVELIDLSESTHWIGRGLLPPYQKRIVNDWMLVFTASNKLYKFPLDDPTNMKLLESEVLGSVVSADQNYLYVGGLEWIARAPHSNDQPKSP